MVVYRMGSLCMLSTFDFNLQYFKFVQFDFDAEVDNMVRFLHLPFSHFSCRTLRIALALLWISGLIFGSFLGVRAGEYLLPVNDIAVSSDGFEFLPVLFFRVLPLLFCCISVLLSRPSVLFVAVFLRAFLFSLSAVSFYSTFSTSAWLISVFMLLGDALILSSCWFVLFASLDSSFNRQAIVISMAAIVFVSLFDYLCIAPFMAKLI